MEGEPKRSPSEPSTAALAEPAEAPFPELEITWARTLAILWSLYWRSTILTIAAGFSLAVFFRAVRGLMGWDIGAAGPVLGGIAGFLIYVRVLHRVLQKRFKEFTVKVFPCGQSVMSSVRDF